MTTLITPAELDALDAVWDDYNAALARIKAIEPTPIDDRFPESKARICSDKDVEALDAFNYGIRNAYASLSASLKAAWAELADYRDAASVEATLGDEARIDADALAARLAEAERLLRPFADVTINGLGKSGYYADLDTITNEDCAAAAAFLARTPQEK